MMEKIFRYSLKRRLFSLPWGKRSVALLWRRKSYKRALWGRPTSFSMKMTFKEEYFKALLFERRHLVTFMVKIPLFFRSSALLWKRRHLSFPRGRRSLSLLWSRKPYALPWGNICTVMEYSFSLGVTDVTPPLWQIVRTFCFKISFLSVGPLGNCFERHFWICQCWGRILSALL